MRLRLILFLILVILTAANAEFQRKWGGPQLERGVHASALDGGGFVVVGVTEEGGDPDALLVRFDGEGEALWHRRFGGSGTDNGWCVHPTAEGFIFAGYTDSFGAGGFDFLLIATDATGDELWRKTYGGETDDLCWSLLLVGDGYALLGETLDAATGAEDVYLVRVDGKGEELWSRTYGGAAGDRGFSMVERPSGGFVIAGQTYSEGAGERDMYLIGTDAEGHMEWVRTLGGPARDLGHCIAPCADGDYIVTGYTASFASDAFDPWLVKVSDAGTIQWSRVLPVPGVCRGITGAEAAGGGFYLTGFRFQPANGSGAAVLIHTDPEGYFRWSRDFFPTVGGQSFGYTVRATDDGGSVFTGHASDGADGNLDLIVVKTDP